MEGFVYILKTKGNHYYVGSTQDLERRLTEHRLGKTESLKRLLPIELLFSQKYHTVTEARRIEAKLKKFKNRKIIEQIISEGGIKITGD